METQSNSTKLDLFYQKAEFNRLGINSTLLIVTGCLGGVAVGLGAVENIIALCLLVITTMTTLSLILAISPIKAIIWSAVIALLIDFVFITYYLIY